MQRQKGKTAERRETLTTRGRARRPHQLLLPGPAALAVRVHPDAAKTQQVLFTGDLDCADGVHGLVRNEG